MHFPGLVVEHLLFYSFRNQHEKPLFRMGYITFSRTYFCCGLPPIARGPGPGPGPMGWPCRPNWTHGTRAPWGPWGPWTHVAQEIHRLHRFIGPQRPEHNLFRSSTQKFACKLLVAMKPMTLFREKQQQQNLEIGNRVLKMNP